MDNHVYEQIGFKPRFHQKIIDETNTRFTVLVCHRRFGKTVLTIAKLFQAILDSEREHPRGIYLCPTYQQGQRVAWDYMLQFASRIDGSKVNKVNKWIDFECGGRIMLGSADNPDANRGIYLDAAAIDEPAWMPTRMWTEVIRPALSDRLGTCYFLGTPAGRHGMLWDLWNYAKEGDEDWSRFMFKASDTQIVSDKELKANRNIMTRAEYDQEWECSFAASIKGSYVGPVCADAEREGRITNKVVYDPNHPVHVALCNGERQENACWFFQFDQDGMVNFLRYKAYPRASIGEMVAEWRKLPYKVIYKVVVPTYAKGGTGRSDRLREYGYKTLNPPKGKGFEDSIEEMRALIARSRFHTKDTRDGLEAVRQYRQARDDKHQVFKRTPVQDWTLDPSDAYRGVAVCIRQLEKEHVEPDYSLVDDAVAWG